ncbi:Olee1-like protein [Linum perenne]
MLPKGCSSKAWFTAILVALSSPSKSVPGCQGAKVSLQCICRQNRTVTYKVEGVTNMAGRYRLPVVGDHEEDICAVKLVSSPEKECSEKFKFIDSARVLLTENEGLVDSTRYANPIGYMKATTDPRCAKILEDMGMNLATAQSKYLM